jgi:hypothetical protein
MHNALATDRELTIAANAYNAILAALRAAGLNPPNSDDWRSERLKTRVTEFVLLLSD